MINRWVIISTERAKRPTHFTSGSSQRKDSPCPFDAGYEKETPPEIWAIRGADSKSNEPGWITRVIPNKFPALTLEGDLGQNGVGMYDRANGFGAHEIIIETPAHDKDLEVLSLEEIGHIFNTYRDRIAHLKQDKRLKYIMIFKNAGSRAGASLEHPHSQLIALPFIPKRVADELEGSRRYFEDRQRCGYCDMVAQELRENQRMICQNERFFAFAPFASRFPFECWVLPKQHASDFSEIQQSDIALLAKLIKDLLSRLKRTLKDPAYNLLVHSAPVENLYEKTYHWHIEIVPRLREVVGFEWGTGVYINPTPPEVAASCLRDVVLSEDRSLSR